METLSSLKEKFKGAECVIETEKDYPDLKGFENCYFMVDDYVAVLESDYYCLADERMFSFFRDYYEDIPNDRQKSKKQAFKLLLKIYAKKSRFKKVSNGKISLVSLSTDNKILYTIIPSIREQQLRKELKKAEK